MRVNYTRDMFIFNARLNSKPTTGAKKDRRHDFTSVIDELVANGARFLRCDREKECFFPMDMAKVRARLSDVCRKGLKKVERKIELCENYHTLLKVHTQKGCYQVIIILFYSSLCTLLSNLTHVLLIQMIQFIGKGKCTPVGCKKNISKKAAEALVKKVYKSLHPSFNAAFFASEQMFNDHVNELKIALKK